MNLKRWEKRGKRGLTRVLSRALRARDPVSELPDFRDLESILLIRQHNQLGDMLLTTPVFRAIRARAPRARLDLVSGPANHEAVRECAHLDEVLMYDKAACLRDPRAAKRFADRLRGARYDLVLVLSTVSFSYTSGWLAALAGARRRAGRPGPDGRGESTARDLFHWVLPPPEPGRHQAGVNLDLATPFGAAGDDWSPEIFLEERDEAEGCEALDDRLGPTGDGLRVVIHPGAGKRPNRWPAERFGEVARALAAAGHRVAVATGPSETDLFAGVDRGAGCALPRIPGLGLHALAGAIKHADLLLANDTGVLHLGAAVGVPVLTLFGPTDPAQWC
ncbi:MAG TPA: glycosyltransferase family 9 protein, partial [bacterium]|nr:glycosyltransferase family 9 protein [bacterium]